MDQALSLYLLDTIPPGTRSSQIMRCVLLTLVESIVEDPDIISAQTTGSREGSEDGRDEV